jgi:hypothetical protein
MTKPLFERVVVPMLENPTASQLDAVRSVALALSRLFAQPGSSVIVNWPSKRCARCSCHFGARRTLHRKHTTASFTIRAAQ